MDEQEASNDPEDGMGDSVEFNLLIDGGSVKMLTRSDFDDGSMQYRSGDEWIDITPDDTIPFLDELPNTRVTGDAVDIWDSAGDDPQKSDFTDVLLDDRD